jgi:hypothetical protein
MRRQLRITAITAALGALSAAAAPSSCLAITIVVDYSKDSNGFFAAGNPTGQGAAARAALEAAASFYSTILTDTMSAMTDPPNFTGSLGGTGRWDWDLHFDHPATGAPTVLTHQTIPANVYRLYAGGRTLPAGTLAVGGTSTPSFDYAYSGAFTSGELAYVKQLSMDFEIAITTRGQTGYSSWGGFVSFDLNPATVWHYNVQALPPAGANDFYSVALHELAHALGIGSSRQWNDLATGSHFAGNAARAAYGGSPPPLSPQTPSNPTPEHWAEGTMSRVLGTSTTQEALMDPTLTKGTRKLVTALDAAALTDIGWIVSTPTFNSADFNRDGTVNRPDLTLWRTAFKTNAGADADGDGDSDGHDFLIWQRRLGQNAIAASAPRGVPEPRGAALAAWIAAWVAGRRRQSVGSRAA